MKIRYKDYIAHVFYSEEDECLIGEVINTRAIIAFHADSESELADVFADTIEDHILIRKELGEEIEKPVINDQDLREKNSKLKVSRNRPVYHQNQNSMIYASA